MFQKILVATDGSEYAEKSIRVACSLSGKYGAFLYIIHVYEGHKIPQSVLDYVKGEHIAEEPEYVYLEMLSDAILKKAGKEAEKLGVENFQAVLLRGNPAERIVEFAKEHGVDMIVMGTHGAGNIGSMFMGSVSRKINHLSACTCVTVK